MHYFEVKVLWRNTNVSKQTQSFLHKRKTSAMEYIVFSGEWKKNIIFFEREWKSYWIILSNHLYFKTSLGQ